MQSNEKIFVGIDFSKEKFNACLFRDNFGIMGEAEFPNTRGGYYKLMLWVKKTSELGKDYNLSDVLFCGEATGMCGLGLSEYICAKNGKIWIENARTIKLGSGLSRNKDDKADAEMIAYYAKRFYEPGKTILFSPQTPKMKELRSLYEFRNRMVRDRIAINNQIKSTAFDGSSLAKRLLKRNYQALQKEEILLTKAIAELLAKEPEFEENYRLLTSFIGIGPITAAMFILYTDNFKRFNNARQFACYGGMAPFGKQSGTSIHVKPHVSPYAHKHVKSALVQVAKTAIVNNPVIKTYAQRLRDSGKHEGVVVNNVKNKIIHIVFKMMETRKPWDAGYQEKHTGKAGKNPPKTQKTFKPIDVWQKHPVEFEAEPLSASSYRNDRMSEVIQV